MVIDCCTQIFQIATGPSGPTAGFHILPASLRIHLSQHLAAEEIVEAADPVGELGYFRLRGPSLEVSRFAMSVIDCQNIGDVDVFNVADATRGAVLRSDIPYEGVFGGPRRLSLSLARKDSCGNLAVSIADGPDGVGDETSVSSLGLAFVESRAFADTRHSSLMRSICASVVKSLPAMRSITSRPRNASLRSPELVIDPSGNANEAAVDSRMGSSGLTSLRRVDDALIVARSRDVRCAHDCAPLRWWSSR